MDDYDVVIDALQKHRDKLWEMTERNMNSDYVGLNVMDDIRFYQIGQLDAAIETRKNAIPCQTCVALARTVMMDQTAHDTPHEWVGLTDDEIIRLRHLYDPTAHWSLDMFARVIEAKLKEKNT